MSSYHNAVLLHDSVAALITNKDGVYVDCTFGGGGHTKEILNNISENGKLYAFDQDKDALVNKLDDTRLVFIAQNFRFLANYLKFYGIEKVEGILADLGVSSHQFDVADRGFSTRFEGDLDMRMNVNQTLSAQVVVNDYSEEQLADVFYYYGEIRQARKIAREIVNARKTKLKTTNDLKNIFQYIPKNKQNKFYAQLFQAIRIEVNDELMALKELLLQSVNVLKPKGKLVVISYHSLEDRLVKRFLKIGLFEGEPERDLYGNWKKPFSEEKSKVIVPSDEEIKHNSRARSAKLRIGIRNEI